MKEGMGRNSVPKFKHILTNEKKVVTFPIDFCTLWIEVSWYPKIFKTKLKIEMGSNLGFLYTIGKVLKCIYQKYHIPHLEIWSSS
jgi:hypothetical protein